MDKKIKEQEAKAAKEKEPVEKQTTPTEIVVSTVPAELIQTEGEASFKIISGTSLLYADNTLDEIFKDINSQKNFILIAGRWYSSSAMNGPWDFVAADQLPADFAKIPAGSEKDGVLASVAGTDAAEEAKADAVIPQTAKIDRATAKCTVTYDGDPKFSPIDNTNNRLPNNNSNNGRPSGFDRPDAKPAADGYNNIFSDKEGNIFQKDNKGNWNQRDKNQWKPADNNRLPNDISRDDRSRDRANTREQMQRPSTRPSPQSRPTPHARPTPQSRPMPQSRPAPAGGRGRIGRG
ncbi:MAG: hypothetical protein ABL870_05760 [Sediminibacterium sp.]